MEDKAIRAINADIIPVFIEALRDKYDWLYRQLTEDVPDASVLTHDFEAGFKRALNFGCISPEFQKEGPSILSVVQYGGKKVKSLLEAGGVPCLPAVAVEREELLKNIRQEMEIIKRNQYLVICGMAGSGKTVLAIQAVSDESIVSANFQDGVFWLAIGKECSESKDALLAKVNIIIG